MTNINDFNLQALDALKEYLTSEKCVAVGEIGLDYHWEGFDKTAQINTMLDAVKKTLPQKIDEVTTWTDILYENGIISYIYQADVDISLFSEEEKQILKDSIKSEACEEIFKSVCPQVLPVFIENGTNMTVKYIDKNNKEISFCELNKETCAN